MKVFEFSFYLNLYMNLFTFIFYLFSLQFMQTFIFPGFTVIKVKNKFFSHYEFNVIPWLNMPFTIPPSTQNKLILSY
jgi:hypothetical protein